MKGKRQREIKRWKNDGKNRKGKSESKGELEDRRRLMLKVMKEM
jgi:hypothetical protein